MKREPRGTKYKRTFKIKKSIENIESRMSFLGFAIYGLVLEQDTTISYEQLDTLYRFLRKKYKKKISFKINASCITPFTKKPVSARMGKGKGAKRGYNIFLRKGTILLEISTTSLEFTELVLGECAQKFPVKVRFICLNY